MKVVALFWCKAAHIPDNEAREGVDWRRAQRRKRRVSVMDKDASSFHRQSPLPGWALGSRQMTIMAATNRAHLL